ncbi:aminopeptidase, partial [Thermus scotoductus]|uniref:aminopeptidase n=1 Tax=Thermus scotoductus TaxID=37636 RepID=UPI001561E170
MGTEEFREYLKGALFLDREDPVGAWRALSRFQEALIGRLSQGRELRIQAPGTDLRLSVAGRRWINSDGRRNMPSGEEYLLAALATDEGARRLGEVGIGTNFGLTRPTGLILLDEKMGGTVHLALGRSYPETGGKNPSALHWDLVLSLREGSLLLDGEPLVERGRFVGVSEPHPF